MSWFILYIQPEIVEVGASEQSGSSIFSSQNLLLVNLLFTKIIKVAE